MSTIILAGGRGERLGADKATVLLGTHTLLERVLERLAPLGGDRIVVLRVDQEEPAPLPEGVRVVRDDPAHVGVLAGLAAGLAAARHAWAAVAACDMPYVEPRLYAYMRTLAEGYDVVVPRMALGLEPLHALYHRRCLPAILQALAEQRRRATAFYEGLRVRYVPAEELVRLDPQERSFFNVNTPADLAQAREWLACGEDVPAGSG